MAFPFIKLVPVHTDTHTQTHSHTHTHTHTCVQTNKNNLKKLILSDLSRHIRIVPIRFTVAGRVAKVT